MASRSPWAVAISSVALLASCLDSKPPVGPPAPVAVAGTQARFDLGADTSALWSFYSLPYPSDLRLAADRGAHARPGPDLRGFPNPRDNDFVRRALDIAGDRPGFPVVPVAYFAFDAPLAKRDPDAVVSADKAAPLLLVDVDPASAERGKLFPVVADTPLPDDYIPHDLLTVAARPGIVLAPGRTYAFVVLRSLGDAAGAKLGVPLAMAQLAAGVAPDGARGAAAKALYAPLWETLRTIGVDPGEVASATVFSTGDVVAELAALGDLVKRRYSPTITGLHVDPDDGAAHPRYCELVGEIRYPQFQRGTAPFDDPAGGLFEDGADGVPVQTGEVTSPVTITLPKQPMPAAGYPLSMYFHGSDGDSKEVVDLGPKKVLGGDYTKGEGPAHVLAALGLAMASSGLPVSPERLPSHSGPCVTVSGYLNFCNLDAMRDTFRQGVIEQRLLIEALRTLEIPPAVAAACSGLALPAGASGYRFDPDKLVAMGLSMGGMYTNMIGATEPRIRAVAPTGAGGFWTYFILHTTLVSGASEVLALSIGASDEWTFMHPALHLIHTMWEPIEPMVYMPRLALRPLGGHPTRPIYEPVGKDDKYFPTVLYDAIALAYGNQQAGDEVWLTMQPALALGGHGGIAPYPLSQNLTSELGARYTGVVVQYLGDGLNDPHVIVAQLDTLKYQLGCFFSTFLETGAATVPAPASFDTPCAR